MISWDISLEQWCQRAYGSRRLRMESRYPMAPIETYRPELHLEVPVLVLVLTAAARPLHAPLGQAIELIRASTYGFRPVLVTDIADSPAARAGQWAVEQVPHASSWYLDAQRNWLELAARHVDDTQLHYTAQYVLAPTTEAEALDAVELLAQSFDATAEVHQAAREIISTAGLGAMRRTGARGRFAELPLGEQELPLVFDSGATAVLRTLRREKASGVLISVDNAAQDSLLQWADAAGVNAASVPETDALLSIGVAGEQPGSASLSVDFIEVVNAAADALAEGGPALAVVAEQQGSGVQPAEVLESCAVLTGVISTGDTSMQLTLRDGTTLTFPESALARVITGLGRLDRT